MELHPLCTLFPRMSDSDFDCLCKDIEENGLRQPIVTYEGMILDGGNRYRACMETGTAPKFQEFAGGSIVSYVLSANLHRRHLSPGQQAAIVASCADWAKSQTKGGDRRSDQSATLHFETVADRAAQSGASIRTQKMADKVAKKAPGLAARVAHGEISLPKAVAELNPKKAPKPDPDFVAEYTAEEAAADELSEAREAIRHLSYELDRLKDQIAVGAIDGSDEDRATAAEIIAGLRQEVATLEAENRAIKASRDKYQQENAELKRQCQIQRRDIDKLRAA